MDWGLLSYRQRLRGCVLTYYSHINGVDVWAAVRAWRAAPRLDRGFDFEGYGSTIKYSNDSGPNIYDHRVTGIGLAWLEDGEWNEVYIPYAHRTGYDNADEGELPDVLSILVEGGWGWGMGYEAQVSANHGVPWRTTDAQLDAQIAHWLAGQQFRLQLLSLELKVVAKRLGLATLGSFDEVVGKRDTRDVPVAELGPYCARDARLAVEAGKAAYALLEEHDLAHHFHSLDMPLLAVTNAMSREGYPIDRAEMERLGALWGEEMDRLAVEFAKLTETTVLMPVKRKVPSGEYFKNGKAKMVTQEFQEPTLLGATISNDRMVSRWLYDELKWLPSEGMKRNLGGVFDVDKETLATIHPTCAEGRRAVELRLRYNKLSKLKSTYLVSLQNIAAQYADGKLHPGYRICGTATQRFSSSNPNGQNMPKQSDEAKAWGKCLLVEPGWRGWETDLSQIELRLAAHYSGDTELMNAYLWGEDIHAKTMALVGCERRPAKVLNFSNLYRISPATLATKLAIQLKRDVSVEEAKDFQTRFLKAYAGLRRYWTKAIEVATDRGYARTVDGFKQFLDMTPRKTKWGKLEPLWQSGQSAINTPIQGSAGGIMKLAMVALHKQFRKDGRWMRDVRFVGQVHDSLRYLTRGDLPEAETQAIVKTVEHAMNTAVVLRVPVESESKEMTSGYWGE